VIPAYNEANTIKKIVNAVSDYGIVIVVDDASDDNTGIAATESGAIVVNHLVNCGYDKAINSGFAKADLLGCEYIITMDADGQHNPDIVESYINFLDQGAEVVIGRRDKFQRFAEHLFAWVASKKWGIFDPLCGMKAYRISVYRALGHFDSYGSVGTELSIFAAKNEMKIAQLDIKTRDRLDAPRFGNFLLSNMYILYALWKGLFLKVT
jgi:glycosyltransferase involved in cell wall biosynthesis